MNQESFNKFLTFLKTVRLGWLVPFILLAKGEDRDEQIKAIFTGVCIPLFAIVAFFFAWSIVSKQIVTKSGRIPGPGQVWSAWGSLRNEARLEQIKEQDHVRRLRERRMQNVERYSALLDQIPGGAPDFGSAEQNEKALKEAAMVFDEVNEILDVSNKVSVVADEEAATSVIEGFQFDSSREFGKIVMARLLPKELAYKAAEEAFNASTELSPSGTDTEKEAATKAKLKKRREKELAAEKGDLLIERQQIMTLATKKALNVESTLPASTKSALKNMDSTAAALSPRLDAWYADVLKAEEATGVKFADEARLRLLARSFEDSPYPGKETYTMQIVTSLKTVFMGFLIASLIAVPLGIVCGLSKNINNAFNPLIQIFKPVSPLAWLPIVMLVVGALYVSDDPMFEISFINSAITVALCSLWPTLVNTAVGVAGTDKDYLNVAKVLKLGWFQQITKVILPASLPMVFTGLRLSLGVGWMVLIAAEMLAQNPGLGKFVWDMFQNGSSETLSMIMVAVFTIGIIGFFLDTVMLSLQQLVSFGEATV